LYALKSVRKIYIENKNEIIIIIIKIKTLSAAQ
jgi:hypothetical protein